MKTYIPKKHYKSFWKPRIYAGAYGKYPEVYLMRFIVKLLTDLNVR